jgi:hypothetical protein
MEAVKACHSSEARNLALNHGVLEIPRFARNDMDGVGAMYIVDWQFNAWQAFLGDWQ